MKIVFTLDLRDIEAPLYADRVARALKLHASRLLNGPHLGMGVQRDPEARSHRVRGRESMDQHGTMLSWEVTEHPDPMRPPRDPLRVDGAIFVSRKQS